MAWAQVATLAATVFIAIIVGLVYNDRRLSDLWADMAARFTSVDARFTSIDGRFASMDARFAEIHTDLREIRGFLQEALRTRA